MRIMHTVMNYTDGKRSVLAAVIINAHRIRRNSSEWKGTIVAYTGATREVTGSLTMPENRAARDNLAKSEALRLGFPTEKQWLGEEEMA